MNLVAVFDTGGALIKQLAVGGALNAPWGIAIAPASFGAVSGALVGNFGDGKINAFDPGTGNLVGTLGKTDETAIVVDGLWGIAFGNDVQSQPSHTLFFASGPGDDAHGLYGRIDLKCAIGRCAVCAIGAGSNPRSRMKRAMAGGASSWPARPPTVPFVDNHLIWAITLTPSST